MDLQDIPPIPFGTNEEAWRESYQRIIRGCQAFPEGNPAKLRDVFLKMRNGEVDFDQLPLPTGNGRIISVPLQKLDKCRVCAVTTNLRLCNSCASVRPPTGIFRFSSLTNLRPFTAQGNVKSSIGRSTNVFVVSNSAQGRTRIFRVTVTSTDTAD